MKHPNEISQSVINNYCVDVEKENKLLNWYLKKINFLKSQIVINTINTINHYIVL